MKQCSVCNQEKPLTEYSPDKRISSGVQSRCKVCYSKIMRERRLVNPKAHRNAVKKYTAKNYTKKLEYNNKYRIDNPDKVTLWKRKDRQVNKARVLADNAMRRTKLISKNTPEIKQMYALRDFYKAMSLGEIFHVDHIIPISKGGLHEISNLQIISAKDNLRKGASYK
jgi:5-methylcytosine-specific restriction endonuclease McrA